MTEMSDTPRTDVEIWKPRTEAGCYMDDEVVDANFARQLERELNALRQVLHDHRLLLLQSWLQSGVETSAKGNDVLKYNGPIFAADS